MVASEILKVLYAPHKVFKEIVQNPKYLGVLLVFILVIAAQSAYYYAQSEKIYYEQSSPSIDQLGTWTTNATLWTASANATITNNYQDFLNSSYNGENVYGNGSLQFSASNSNDLSMTLPNFNSVNCGSSSFQNLSVRITELSPQTAPTKVTLTLYSLSNPNYFQYDLTSAFSNASLIGFWNNVTVPIGQNSANWQSNGNPQWTNITGLKLEFSFASNGNITLLMEGLFFRGLYQTFSQISGAGLTATILQQTIFSFVFEWLFLTGLLYLIIKGLKGQVTWKPLFIAIGFLLIVIAIQAIISLAATQTLPIVHSPIEFQTQLQGEAAAINNSINAQTQAYSLITSIVQLLTYVWIVALGAFVVRALQPEFSLTKSALASAAALVVTIILMSLLGI